MPIRIRSAQDREELLGALRKIDISVPGRISGRTTDHTETWTACHLLSTLAENDRLKYPLSASHRDRPDCLIEQGNVRTGVEITEAISQNYAAYCALAEREFPNVFLEPAHFQWGSAPLTTEEMRELLRQSQLISDGWVGNRAEQEWAIFVQSAVVAKLAKLAHRDFEKFDQNWLAIYDNLPLPNVNLEHAVALLRPPLHECWSSYPSFDAIYVEHGPVIVELTNRDSVHLILNELW